MDKKKKKSQLGVFKKIKNFLLDVKTEMKKVHWPSRKEASKLTLIVVVISLLVAGFISLFDFIFTQVFNLTF